MIFKPRIAVSIMVFSTPSDAVISKFNIKIEILFLVQKKKNKGGKAVVISIIYAENFTCKHDVISWDFKAHFLIF